MRLVRLVEIARRADARHAKMAREACSRRGSQTSAAGNVPTHRTRTAPNVAKAVEVQAHKHTNNKAQRLSLLRMDAASGG